MGFSARLAAQTRGGPCGFRPLGSAGTSSLGLIVAGPVTPGVAGLASLMSRLMLVTPHVAHAPTGGRALLSQLNLKCLRAILADCLVVHALDREGNTGW